MALRGASWVLCVMLAGCGPAPVVDPVQDATIGPAEDAAVRYVFANRVGANDLAFTVDGKSFNELELGAYFRENRAQWPGGATQLRVVYDSEVPLAWFSHSCRRFRYFGFEKARCMAGGGTAGRAIELKEVGPSILLPEPGWPSRGDAGSAARPGEAATDASPLAVTPHVQALADRLLQAILSGEEAELRTLVNGREVDATEMSWLVGGPELRFGAEGDRKSARQVLVGQRVLTRALATEQADGSMILEAVFLPARTAVDFGDLSGLIEGGQAKNFRDFVMCEFVVRDGRTFMRNIGFADTDVFDD